MIALSVVAASFSAVVHSDITTASQMAGSTATKTALQTRGRVWRKLSPMEVLDLVRGNNLREGGDAMSTFVARALVSSHVDAAKDLSYGALLIALFH